MLPPHPFESQRSRDHAPRWFVVALVLQLETAEQSGGVGRTPPLFVQRARSCRLSRSHVRRDILKISSRSQRETYGVKKGRQRHLARGCQPSPGSLELDRLFRLVPCTEQRRHPCVLTFVASSHVHSALRSRSSPASQASFIVSIRMSGTAAGDKAL